MDASKVKAALERLREAKDLDDKRQQEKCAACLGAPSARVKRMLHAPSRASEAPTHLRGNVHASMRLEAHAHLWVRPFGLAWAQCSRRQSSQARALGAPDTYVQRKGCA